MGSEHGEDGLFLWNFCDVIQGLIHKFVKEVIWTWSRKENMQLATGGIFIETPWLFDLSKMMLHCFKMSKVRNLGTK